MKKTALIFIEDGSFTFDNRCKHQAQTLINNGWKVTVISPKYSNDPFYKKTKQGVNCYYYPKINANSAFGHVIEHSITLFFGCILTFWVFIIHGFSVFHACNPMDILWFIAMPYKLFGKKFIFDQHDLCPELYLSRLEGNEENFFYKSLILFEKISYVVADRVIVTNESYKKNVLNRGGVNKEKIYVVRNGPNLEKFVCNRGDPTLKGKDEILVGYIGNMNKQDGVDYLLDIAYEIIKKRNINQIRFILIGGGSVQQQLLAQSMKMDLDSHVKFTGRISNEEMLNILNSCDICVQPDPLNPLNDLSTMNKVMEYMALEKPVVSFDLTETKVSCGNAALYAKDIIQFSDHICLLAENSKLRKSMGVLGKKRIENKLAWKYSEQFLLKAYDFNN